MRNDQGHVTITLTQEQYELLKDVLEPQRYATNNEIMSYRGLSPSPLRDAALAGTDTVQRIQRLRTLRELSYMFCQVYYGAVSERWEEPEIEEDPASEA